MSQSRIPILTLDKFVLVSIQTELHDQLALALQEDLSNHVSRTRAKGVLIDISSLQVVDSFVGRILAEIASVARLLGAETVVAGMQPAVAITLVELGVPLRGLRTALDMDQGMRLLREAVEASQEGKPHGRSSRR